MGHFNLTLTLEFPEVLSQGGFDVILSNPPFVAGRKLSGIFGDKYRHYLSSAYDPFRGQTDLCAAFCRKSFSLLKHNGMLGMVATNTISQGDTRESGLATIIKEGGSITFARRFIKWQGAATVEVNLVTLLNGFLNREALLDGHAVAVISSRFESEPEVEPTSLKQNESKAFSGDRPIGNGFVLDVWEADQLVKKNYRNADCLYLYLNGAELNAHPEQKPSRYIICFLDWGLEQSREYPDLLKIVEDRVKPERDKLRSEIPVQAKRKKYWWLFGSRSGNLYRSVSSLERVLVRSLTGDRHAMAFVPLGWIYDQGVNVFAYDDNYHFTLFQSSIHEAWALKFGPTIRTDKRYTVTECFDTFPFPQDPPADAQEQAARVGGEYHEHRRRIMLARQIGLTATYNLFHSPDCSDSDIARLRELHAEMDRAILACYCWQDLDPQHGFWQNERGQTRYTVSPTARREILRRLLVLNQEIAEKERKNPAVSGKR